MFSSVTGHKFEGSKGVRASRYAVSSRHYLHGTQMANRPQTQTVSGQREQQAAQW